MKTKSAALAATIGALVGCSGPAEPQSLGDLQTPLNGALTSLPHNTQMQLESPLLKEVLLGKQKIEKADEYSPDETAAIAEFQRLFADRTGLDLGPHGADGTFNNIFAVSLGIYLNLHDSAQGSHANEIDSNAIKTVLENEHNQTPLAIEKLRRQKWFRNLPEEEQYSFADRLLSLTMDPASIPGSTVFNTLTVLSENGLSADQCSAILDLTTHLGLYEQLLFVLRLKDLSPALLDASGDTLAPSPLLQEYLDEIQTDVPAELRSCRDRYLCRDLNQRLSSVAAPRGAAPGKFSRAELLNACLSQEWFQNENSEWQALFVKYLNDRQLYQVVSLSLSADSLGIDEQIKSQFVKITLFCADTYSQTSAVEDLLHSRDGIETPLYLCQDSEGRTLLDNILSLCEQEFPVEARWSQADTLQYCIREVVKPGKEINQGSHGTCSVTAAVQYQLAVEQPAELFRIYNGLLSPEGEVTLQSGATLVRVDDSLGYDLNNGRSQSEQVFQAAAMELGNGPKRQYSNLLDRHFDTEQVEPESGLTRVEIARVKSSFFGEDFVSEGVSAYTDQEKIELLRELPSGSSLSIRWRENSEAKKRLTGKEHSYHALYFLGFDEEAGTIQWRNPHGSSKLAQGSLLKSPERTLVDADNGVEAMELTEFLDRWNGSVYSSEELDRDRMSPLAKLAIRLSPTLGSISFAAVLILAGSRISRKREMARRPLMWEVGQTLEEKNR